MGTGRIGKSYPAKSMKGKCREAGCTTKWNSTEEYLKCEGCSFEGCKIKESYNKRQSRNAAIETDRIITRMRKNRNRPQQKQEEEMTGVIIETTHLVESSYVISEGENEITKDVPPVMKFELK